MKEIKIDSDFFNKYLFFFHETIGNNTDRNGNKFSRIFFLDDRDLIIKATHAEKFKLGKHSIIPCKRDGEDFKPLYLNVRVAIIDEDEARKTPCALYCWKCTAGDKVFYKVGITATEYARDTSNKGLIQVRIDEVKEGFNEKGNGDLEICPLFIVKSNLYNCIILENAIHRNSVFCGDIAQKYNKFSGDSECCNFLDFDHFKRLKVETDELSAELKLKNSRLREQFLEKYNLEKNNNDEADFNFKIDCRDIEKKLELNGYVWEKFGNFEDNGIIYETNDKIIQNFRNFEHLKYSPNWIRLLEYNQHSS